MSKEELVTGGYLFSTNADYRDAKEEEESINFLRSKANLDNPKTALKLYHKLVEDRTFHTVVGFSFLKELQNTVLTAGIVKAEKLEEIYIPAQNTEHKMDAENLEEYKFLAEKQKKRIRNVRIINFFLTITVVIMLILALYTDRTMYADFENKVIDRYSSWEDNLNKREQALDKREEALNQTENKN